ncbi:MAG: PAS domain S-box protein [Chlorobia bacterium]|nr:PAS domain S-box protein [Fimbriimonadaceae bacterium]
MPSNESERLNTLNKYEILDSEPEQAFDDLVALASYICETPISTISLVDVDRQWFKASLGLTEQETRRDVSFCQHTIQSDGIMVVPDALEDSRFKDSPLVTGGQKVRFYAGVPLIAPNGMAVGALCVKDTRPRELTEAQMDALKRLANQVVGQLELRKQNLALEQQTLTLEDQANIQKELLCHAEQAEEDTKKAFLSLAESEERFRAFAENASDIFLMRDIDGNILYSNQAASSILGYAPEELLLMSVQDLRIWPDVCGVSSPFASPENGQTTTFEGLLRRKDGDVISAEVKVSKVDLQGTPMFFVIARDQTEQLRSIEEMRKGEERFNLVCQATNDVVWDLNIVTGEAWLSPNQSMVLATDKTGATATKDQWVDAIHPDDTERITESLHTALSTGASTWQEEYRLAKADGTYADVLDRAFVIVDDNGAPTRMIGAAMDVTNRKQSEQDRLDRDRADRANLAKSEFLSRMSHELRTPLNSILGFAQLLEMYQPTDQQKECVGRILTGGKHLLGLINEVLDLSRIESGNMEISREAVKLVHVVDEAISLTQPLAMGKSVTVVTDPSADLNLFARADRQRLLQVVINLISNGVKYNREGGFVHVGFSTTDAGTVNIVVRDTGPGIDQELAHRVFMPFDRLGIEQTQQIEGTGLGLALCKSMVEAMHGQITFTSEIGSGTVFKVELELAKEPEIEVGHIVAAHSVHPSTATRLVYIEDNESNVALMASLIESRPQWTLDVAMSGRAGLQTIFDNPPNLVLLDLDLPDISGYDVLLQLRANPEFANLPILIVSADATPDRIARLLAAGASGFVTKPFKIRDLLNDIAYLLSVETDYAA